MIFKKNKKAFKLVISNLVGIILALIIIVATAYFLAKIGGIFAGYWGTSGQKSKASLDRLGVDFSELANYQAKPFTLFLDEKYVLVGFSQEKEKKPQQCLAKLCLCVCEGDENCNKDVYCITFKDINTIATNTGTIYAAGEYWNFVDKGLQQFYICRKNNILKLHEVQKKDEYGEEYEDFAKECEIDVDTPYGGGFVGEVEEIKQ